MSFSGHVYGVALNDRAELARLGDEFTKPPYAAAPRAPVVYMKPRASLAHGATRLQAGAVLEAAPTLALLFARDAARCDAATALDHVGAVALAIDLSLPQQSYHRPAVAQKNGNGFLVLGDWTCPALPATLETSIDGELAHCWSLDRLVRGPGQLIADLSAFMTLRAGDVLLVGLPGDAPRVRGGQALSLTASGLPRLATAIEEIEA